MIARALSLRVVFLSLVVGISAGGLTYLLAVVNDAQMVRCYACGKRVKMGANTCHHCGHSNA